MGPDPDQRGTSENSGNFEDRNPQPSYNPNPQLNDPPQSYQPSDPQAQAPAQPQTQTQFSPQSSLPPQTVVQPVSQPGAAQGQGSVYSPAAAAWFAPDDPTTLQAAGYAVPKKRSRKKLFLGIGLVVLLLGLGAGFVFGLYLPNTPNKVWNTAINRSGQALDTLSFQATDTKSIQALKTSDISGDVKATSGSNMFSGDFSLLFDQKSTNGAVNVSVKDPQGSGENKIGLKFLSQLAGKSSFPDVFIQVSGLKSLGLERQSPYAASLLDYDGKWISLSADYLKTLSGNYTDSGIATPSGTPAQQDEQVTASELAAAVRTAEGVVKDYMFTTAPDKALFVKQKFVGKEKVDGVNTYHYKVGVNKDHAKDLCVAMRNAMYDTTAFKKISGVTPEEIKQSKEQAGKTCQDDVKDIKSSDSLDMWIDGSYKLIYKIRAYDDQNKGAYFEIGQNYRGGDQLMLFANYHDEKSKTNVKLTLNVDLKATKTDGQLTVKSENKDSPYEMTVNLNAKATDKPVSIQKPAGATPIEDIIQKLQQQSPFLVSPSPSINNTTPNEPPILSDPYTNTGLDNSRIN